LEPLREADLKLEDAFAVSYISDNFAARMDNARRTVNMYLDMGEALSGIGGGPASGSFFNDLPELRRDLLSLLPERRAALGYSYFTHRGIEGFMYDHSLNMPVDGSEPLPILAHGGDPLLMLAGRQPYSTRTYELAAKWSVKTYGY